MTLTESLRRSLQIIEAAPGIRPDAFARLYFGKDHPGWSRHTRCGNGTRKGGGLVLWAGGQLGKLKSAGLVTSHHELTQRGREALQQTKAPAKGIEPHRRTVPLGPPGAMKDGN